MTNEPQLTTASLTASTSWRPIRAAIALVLGSLLALGPFMAFNGILMPARVQALAPDDKIAIVGLIAGSGVVVATFANVLFGALSDITRTRVGRRAPWILIGSLGAGGSLVFVSNAQTIPLLIVGWCFFQLCLNAMIASLIALLPDRVPTRRRCAFSALYGLGQIIGISTAQIVAPFFLDDITTGMVIFSIAFLVAGPIVALLAVDDDNRHIERERISPKMLLKTFSPPARDSRDYYLVFTGRVLNIIGTYVVSGYQLFIVQDYLGATQEETASILSLLGVVSLISAVVVGTAAGPLSDLAKRRKVFIIGASILMAAGILFLFFVPTPWAMFVWGVCNGLGGGIYNSVEQVVSTEVLPETGSSAKDLGFLNIAATGGQAIAPAATSAVIAITGSFGPIFLVGGGCLLAASVCFGRLRKVR
ncbi:MFS transporter [Clavibacter michiganensis]|uniref:MFS transporter n=1 Tax=Clavibacter michiganensis TaxID=28447 RepID=UPI000D52E08F|nr:MFS transporter [Clavibacter michiganensis]AWF99934.1 MFS transporter [Clavibacter michiganensis subsp. insidiosus]